MITLLSTLLGFFGSAFPDLLKLFKESKDREHELTILRMQMEQAKLGHSLKMEEIGAQADIEESKALYKTFYSGIRWVDALNGTVRPVLAYAFFLLYAMIKVLQFSMLPETTADLPWLTDKAIALLWQDEDRAIFASIVAFYFGSRTMSKVMGYRK